jgi:hypothetical protein
MKLIGIHQHQNKKYAQIKKSSRKGKSKASSNAIWQPQSSNISLIRKASIIGINIIIHEAGIEAHNGTWGCRLVARRLAAGSVNLELERSRSGAIAIRYRAGRTALSERYSAASSAEISWL